MPLDFVLWSFVGGEMYVLPVPVILEHLEGTIGRVTEPPQQELESKVFIYTTVLYQNSSDLLSRVACTIITINLHNFEDCYVRCCLYSTYNFITIFTQV